MAPTMRILLAEDSAVYRHLISAHLNDRGFDLVVAKVHSTTSSLWRFRHTATMGFLIWLLRVIQPCRISRSTGGIRRNSHPTRP